MQSLDISDECEEDVSASIANNGTITMLVSVPADVALAEDVVRAQVNEGLVAEYGGGNGFVIAVDAETMENDDGAALEDQGEVSLVGTLLDIETPYLIAAGLVAVLLCIICCLLVLLCRKSRRSRKAFETNHQHIAPMTPSIVSPSCTSATSRTEMVSYGEGRPAEPGADGTHEQRAVPAAAGVNYQVQIHAPVAQSNVAMSVVDAMSPAAGAGNKRFRFANVEADGDVEQLDVPDADAEEYLADEWSRQVSALSAASALYIPGDMATPGDKDVTPRGTPGFARAPSSAEHELVMYMQGNARATPEEPVVPQNMGVPPPPPPPMPQATPEITRGPNSQEKQLGIYVYRPGSL